MSRSSLLPLVLLATFSCRNEVPEPNPTTVTRPPSPASSGATAAPSDPHSRPTTGGAAGASGKGPAAAPGALAGGGDVALDWTAPAEWQSKPAGGMRKATYEVPAAGGGSGPAELAVFYFGQGQGGDVEANIQRWVKQFSDVPADGVARSTQSANGLAQTIVEIKSGTYSGGMMMGGAPSQPDQGLLGAVVEAPTGKYFFKMSGPAKTVQAQREGFYALLASMKPKAP